MFDVNGTSNGTIRYKLSTKELASFRKKLLNGLRHNEVDPTQLKRLQIKYSSRTMYKQGTKYWIEIRVVFLCG